MTCGGSSASSTYRFFESRETTETRSSRGYSGSRWIEAWRYQTACSRWSGWSAFRRSVGRFFGVLVLVPGFSPTGW